MNETSYFEAQRELALKRLRKQGLAAEARDLDLHELVACIGHLRDKGVLVEPYEVDVCILLEQNCRCRIDGFTIPTSLEERLRISKALAMRDLVMVAKVDQKAGQIVMYFLEAAELDGVLVNKKGYPSPVHLGDASDETAWEIGCAILRSLYMGKPEGLELRFKDKPMPV